MSENPQTQAPTAAHPPRNPYDITLAITWVGMALLALILWLTVTSIRSATGDPDGTTGSMLTWADTLGLLAFITAAAHLISLAVRWRPQG